MTKQLKAKLRVCASCEWVFDHDPDGGLHGDGGCPKCGFAHYGARWVYGDRAYQYKKTQKPWKEKKLAGYEAELDAEVKRPLATHSQ
jgi:rubredoxin